MSPQTARAFLDSLPQMRAALWGNRQILGPVAYARHEHELDTDERAAKAIIRRVLLAGEIGRVKSDQGGEVFSPAREEEVMENVLGANKGPLDGGSLRPIFREIMSASRSRLAAGFPLSCPGELGGWPQTRQSSAPIKMKCFPDMIVPPQEGLQDTPVAERTAQQSGPPSDLHVSKSLHAAPV